MDASVLDALADLFPLMLAIAVGANLLGLALVAARRAAGPHRSPDGSAVLPAGRHGRDGDAGA